MFNSFQKKELLLLARKAIEKRFTNNEFVYPKDPMYNIFAGVFVTLHKGKELRGCIGYIKGYKPLVQSIIELAQAAAFNDPRFPPLKEKELNEINIEISILSELFPVNDINEIQIGRDGLFLHHPYGSGLLLPQVPVEWNWDLHTFLRQLCYKAGLEADCWKDARTKLFRFTAEIFSETEQNSG